MVAGHCGVGAAWWRGSVAAVPPGGGAAWWRCGAAVLYGVGQDGGGTA